MKLILTTEEVHLIIKQYFEKEQKIIITSIASEGLNGIEIDAKMENQNADETKPTKELMDASVREILRVNPGAKIDAIKKVREFTNAGLKEAKDYVEYYYQTGNFKSSVW